eukprot:sb/3466308/
MESFFNISGNTVAWYFDCNNRTNCVNKDNPGVDERFCSYSPLDHKCQGSGKLIPPDQLCDAKVDCLADYADDELHCNHSYGIECTDKWNISRWLPPRFICDNSPNNSFFYCADGSDEVGCDDVVGWCLVKDHAFGDTTHVRNLTAKQMCAPTLNPLISPCVDGRDKVNCTGQGALECNVDGYPSTLTSLALCTGYPICDAEGGKRGRPTLGGESDWGRSAGGSGQSARGGGELEGVSSKKEEVYMDELCSVVEHQCYLHKHYLCDGEIDCRNGSDESKSRCGKGELIQNFTCVRRTGKTPRDVRTHDVIAPVAMKIPRSWLCDGVRDCVGGEDENKELWKLCGEI